MILDIFILISCCNRVEEVKELETVMLILTIEQLNLIKTFGITRGHHNYIVGRGGLACEFKLTLVHNGRLSSFKIHKTDSVNMTVEFSITDTGIHGKE